jgi:hypothetical protein
MARSGRLNFLEHSLMRDWGNELRGVADVPHALAMTATTMTRLLSDAAVPARGQQQTGRTWRPIPSRS